MTSDIISKPLVTVTNVIWSYDHAKEQVVVLLVKKADEPFYNFWSLPETFLRATESADDAALRLIADKIGIQLNDYHTEQLATFSAVGRTKGDRHLALAYMTFLPDMPNVVAGAGALDVAWFTLKGAGTTYSLSNETTTIHLPEEKMSDADFYASPAVQNGAVQLAYDHELIIRTAVVRVRNKLDYAPTILHVLGAEFTLKGARSVYAPFLRLPSQAIDNSNFRKTHAHLFEETGAKKSVGKGRPAKIYRLK